MTKVESRSDGDADFGFGSLRGVKLVISDAHKGLSA